jgi:hypothetical protein
MLQDDLKKAINNYLSEKKDASHDSYVKNLNTYKRFVRPFWSYKFHYKFN